MRALYAFINFLLGKELLPYDILHKKIRIKEPELRCGLRVEEVANLTFDAIDYWRNQIIVRGG